uniref:Uncharacterized protein n=1 Tax=Pseudictyota dubia TaxID=2749911 RepID=A0A7R9Z7B6_9STRA|mmetsp:Transcript_25336/g.47110  ORF Transcript_25336/g.47110 Transcript_25336/m.47110 type:complete len:418 (+) Transcript_25336:160-1413(+)
MAISTAAAFSATIAISRAVVCVLLFVSIARRPRTAEAFLPSPPGSRSAPESAEGIIVANMDDHAALLRCATAAGAVRLDGGDDCGGPVLPETFAKSFAAMKPSMDAALPPLEGSVVSSVLSSDAEESSSSSVTDTDCDVVEGAVDGDVNISRAAEPTTALLPSLREPLRFSFAGLTVWLHLEQIGSDLDLALSSATELFGLPLAIPSPHVTVVYGMTHLDEEEARYRFNVDARRMMTARATAAAEEDGSTAGGSLPKLRPTGVLCDKSFDGVDGEVMDMAWMEITLATSPEHESLVDGLYDIFRRPSSAASVFSDSDESSDMSANCELESGGEDNGTSSTPPTTMPPRPGPWTPHLSLAYDNPEGDSPILDPTLARRLTDEFPTLLGTEERAITAVTLWRTEGRMDEWVELERIDLC